MRFGHWGAWLLGQVFKNCQAQSDMTHLSIIIKTVNSCAFAPAGPGGEKTGKRMLDM